MALTEEARRVLDRHLGARTGDELDPPTCTLTLTNRQLAFLIEAIGHYRATRCPLDGNCGGCEMMAWTEDPSTGGIAVVCPTPCTVWEAELVERVVPQAFPIRALA